MSARRVLIILVVVLPVVVYARSLAYPLLGFDDPIYVSDSPIVNARGLTGLTVAWTRPYFHDYIPLTHTSLWIDSLWGLRGAFPFRAQSLFWHVLCAVLVLFASRRWTGDETLSGLVAVLFAVHPLAVESVAWVAARKNVLSLALFLAAYLAWARGEERKTPVSGRIAAGVLFLAALLAKSASVGFPVIILADSWLLRGRRLLRAVADALPYGLLAGIYLTFAIGWRSDLPHEPLAGPVGIVALDLQVLARYLVNTLVPARLSAFYYLDLRGFTTPATWAAVGILLVVLAAPLAWMRRRKTGVFLLLWMLAGLLPALNLIPIPHPIADRFFYWSLPACLAFLVLAARDGLRFLERLGADPASSGGRVIRILPVALSSLAIAGLALTATARTGVWRSSRALFEDAVRKSPRSSVAHMHLGNVLSNLPSDRDKLRAAEEFRTMLSCPDADERLKQVARDGAALFIARIEHASGRRAHADRLVAEHFAGREEQPDVTLLLSQYDLATGRYESVIRRLEPSILRVPRLVELGRSLLASPEMPYRRSARTQSAARDVYLAVQQRQGLMRALGYLGRAYLASDRPLDAAVAFSLVCALQGPEPELVRDLGRAFEAAGYPTRSAICYRDAEALERERRTAGRGG